MISHGTNSFAVGFSRPSWQNLFQPQVNAAPLSESTAQCLAPLQTCHRQAAADEICSPLHISQACLLAAVLASGDPWSSPSTGLVCGRPSWAAQYGIQDRCQGMVWMPCCQRSQAAGASAYLHNMVRFQSGAFYQGSLCPALRVTEPELPILIVAPGIHSPCTRPHDDVKAGAIMSPRRKGEHDLHLLDKFTTAYAPAMMTALHHQLASGGLHSMTVYRACAEAHQHLCRQWRGAALQPRR